MKNLCVCVLALASLVMGKAHANQPVPPMPTPQIQLGLAKASPSPRPGDTIVTILGSPAKRVFETLTGAGVTESTASSDTLNLIQRHGYGLSCESSLALKTKVTTYRCVLQVTADGETVGFGTDPGGLVGNF